MAASSRASSSAKLPTAEVERQIAQMRRFIESEANEKCQELADRARSEAQMEKNKQFAAGKEQIDEEYTRRYKLHEVRRRIADSNEINANRLRVLETRELALKHVQAEAFARLREIGVPGPAYTELLRKLILQALFKLKEEEVMVVCRVADDSMVQSLLKTCEDHYYSKFQKRVTLKIDTVNKLDSRSCGGVVLSAQRGKILCMNTLEQRLQLACDQQLPEIRAKLFGSTFL